MSDSENEPESTKPVPIGKEILKAVPMIVCVSIITNFAHGWGWLQGLDATSMDTVLHLNPLSISSVNVVSITNGDYAEYFAESSPLDPVWVGRIVERVAQCNPELIVVDLDTSNRQFRSMKVDTGKTKVLWGRNVREAKENERDGCCDDGGEEHSTPESGHESSQGHGKNEAHEAHIPMPDFAIGGVMGNDKPEGAVLCAPTAIRQDFDGVVRRYARSIKVVETAITDDHQGHAEPKVEMTAPYIAARIFKTGEIPKEEVHEAESRVLNYAASCSHVPVYRAGDLMKVEDLSGFKQIFDGKIAVIGGCYRESRDSYNTPKGHMAGVLILAQAIENELQGKGASDPHPLVLGFLEVASGVLLIVLNARLPHTLAPAAGLIAVPLLAATISVLSFSSMALFVDFGVVLFAVWVHIILEKYHEEKKMRKELHELKARVRELSSASESGSNSAGDSSG